MKILIGIPCMDNVPQKFSEALEFMHKPEGTTLVQRPNSLVYDSRNLISLYAIQNDFDYVLWLDSDMVMPKDTIARFQHDLEITDAPMITGVYVKRYFPTAPVLYKEISEPIRKPDGTIEKNIVTYDDFPRDKLFTVDGCGFGCCITSTKLLKEVWDKFGPAFHPYPWAGEDISFCHRVNQLGYRICCDPDVSCGHIGTYVYTVNDLPKRGDNA